MATYTFKCLRCDEEHTHTVSMKEVEHSMQLDCPKCKMNTFQRQVIKPSPIHFVGSGWPGKEI